MIECTKNMASLVSQAFGKQNVYISDTRKMLGRFALDPNVSSVAREAFIVSDADIPARLAKEFEHAVTAKHPDNIIVYVAKKGNTQQGTLKGVDIMLEKPSAEQLSEAVFSKIESIIQKSNAIPQEDEPDGKAGEDTDPDQWPQNVNLDDLFDSVPEDTAAGDDTAGAPIDLKISLDKPPAEAPVVMETQDSLLDRINECSKVIDVKLLTRELNATSVVKEIIKNSADYAGIEDRLKGLNEKIQATYLDTTIPAKEKLDKIRALLYDKGYYRTKTNTIIEQRVEEIITTITEKTKECLDARCEELDRVILNYTATTTEPLATARIAGLLDDRANILLEITALQHEVQEIFAKVDKLATDVVADIAEDSTMRTGSPLIDARLRLSGDIIAPAGTVDTIEHILSVADRKSEEFKEASRKLVILTRKLQSVMNMDRELINALTQIITYMQSNNIEDKIIQQTLIKKSLRFYIGTKGSGRTVIPYVCSSLKSQENYNVLYIDVTGESRLSDYGETARGF